MASFARVVKGTVYEVITAPAVIDGITFQLDEMYPAAFIETLTPCPDWVVPNATYDGTTFINPPAPPVAP